MSLYVNEKKNSKNVFRTSNFFFFRTSKNLFSFRKTFFSYVQFLVCKAEDMANMKEGQKTKVMEYSIKSAID